MAEPVYDNTLQTYFYGDQYKKVAIQFMAIFADMKVEVGKNKFNDTPTLINVPIKYGSMDRVAAAILSGNNTATPMRVPMLAAEIISTEMARDRMKGQGTDRRDVTLPYGGAFPTDLSVIYRATPIPYRVTFELAVLASNSHQLLQIISQIQLLFNPTLMLQTSDDAFDWTKLGYLELLTTDIDRNYPPGDASRLNVATLTFETIMYLSGPANIRDNIIASIRLRLKTIANYEDVNEEVAKVDSIFPSYSTLFDIADIADMDDIPQK